MELFAPVAKVPVIDGFDKQGILDSLKTSGAVEVILSVEDQSRLESLVGNLLVSDIGIAADCFSALFIGSPLCEWVDSKI